MYLFTLLYTIKMNEECIIFAKEYKNYNIHSYAIKT